MLTLNLLTSLVRITKCVIQWCHKLDSHNKKNALVAFYKKPLYKQPGTRQPKI